VRVVSPIPRSRRAKDGRLDGDVHVAPPAARQPGWLGRPRTEGNEFAVDLGDYEAGTWKRPYRLILVVIDLPDPKTGRRRLFPDYFFLITNWRAQERPAWGLVEHYRRRGTFEDRLGEFNAAIGGGLPAGSFETNETNLLLQLLAFNLVGMVRGELEAGSENGWDVKRVQQTVLRAGARVAKHGRRLLVDVAKAAGVLWGRVVDRVRRWWRDPAWGRMGPRPRRWVAPARARPSGPRPAGVRGAQPGRAAPQPGWG
jgi:hypothetical protein